MPSFGSLVRMSTSGSALACVVLSAVDLVVEEHAAEYFVAPGHRARGVVVGVQPARRLDQAGEQRTLRQRQVLGAAGEVRLGRGLCTVGAFTEVDGVEVHLEDLRLVVPLLEFHREVRLADLARRGHLRALVEQDGVADVLLGDRRGTLAVSRGGLDHRADESDGVDAGVAVEALVLDGDDAVREGRGDLGDRHDLAVLEVEPREQLAVRRVDLGGLRDFERVLRLVVRQVLEPGLDERERRCDSDQRRA